MLNNLECHVNLLKALLYSYRTFDDELLAISFDYIFFKATQDFKISRTDLYGKVMHE